MAKLHKKKTLDYTTRLSLFALYNTIAEHQVIPYCLNSDRGTQFFLGNI